MYPSYIVISTRFVLSVPARPSPSLPNGLKAGNIYASSSKILHIPTDIYCKHLIVSYTPFSDKILEKSGNTKKALLTLKRLYPNVKKFSL